MSKESKKEKFDRISNARIGKISEMIRLLGNCSSKTNYSYTKEDAEQIFNSIENEIAAAKRRFGLGQKSKKEQFREIFESEYTWINGFMRNVHRFSEREALFSPDTSESWTYSELNKEANRFANAMLDAGVKKGDVVMYQLLNCPIFVFSYIASHKIDTVNVPISFRMSEGELAGVIDDSMPKVFIYESNMAQTVEKALNIVQYVPEIIIMIDSKKNSETNGSHMTYSEFTNGYSDEDPEVTWDRNIYDETTRLYTSGTTGKMKGVSITSINEVLSAHDVMMHFPLSFNDKTMNTTPWFHRGGLHSGGITPTLYAGGTVVIMRKFDAVTCLRYVERYKLTFIIGVPAVLNSLANEQERMGINLSTLKGIVTMGSALERAACIRFQKVLTPNIFNGYGTTETFWNTFLRPVDLPEMAGTAGRACTDDEVKVVKLFEDRRAECYEEAAKDGKEIGEIIIKSPAKSAYHYYNNDEESSKKFYNGYMYTNDLGTWDENRFISLVGRKDDMIISAGENIYPIQVEEILNEHPKVKECIVTAVPDAKCGETVTAYIIPADKTLTVHELDEHCKNHPNLASFKRPRYYRFVNNIPTNATGKKLHYKIKEYAKEDLHNGLLIRL